MDFGDIKAAIARLQSLVEGWENAGVTELERDIALEELRRVYSEIRFGGAAAVNGKADEPAAVVVPPVVTEESVQEESAAIEGESEEPEIEVELIMSDDEDEPADEALPQEQTAEPTFEPAAEPETASETEEETVPETEAEQTIDEAEVCVDETVVETVATTYDTAENHAESHAENHAESRKPEQSLFGDDEVVLPRSSRRRVLMSLYDDEMPTVIAERADERKPEPKTNPAPEINSEPASETAAAAEKHAEEFAETGAPENGEPKNTETRYGDALGDEMPEPVVMPAIDDEMVLGDVLRADVHTLGESIARAKDISEAAPVALLRAAIGINDRFLLIRDLFGGDAAAYEKAIVAIDSFDNLDDCMVHIVENYSWRSTSDGAKLIMNLIQRKFRK
ncbi:MAG: hypothetical protein KH375_03855 [Alistipes sp.]|nr:hypothetical protein [Alistipes sp.]